VVVKLLPCRHIYVPSGKSNRRGVKKPVIDVWPKGNITPPAEPQALHKGLKDGGVFFCTYSLLTSGKEGGIMKQVDKLTSRKYVPLQTLSNQCC
jgi:hypothetical protein